MDMKPASRPAVNYTDFSVKADQTQIQSGNRKYTGVVAPPPLPVLNKAVNRPQTDIVLSCKPTLYSKIVIAPDTSLTDGMYAHTGYARKQMKGLSYIKERPIDFPLPYITDSENINLPSKLGQPK